MNILFITHRYPHPPNRGDRIRSFHILKRLAELGHVWLATQYDETPSDESRQVLDGLCEEVLLERWQPRKKWLRAGLSLLGGKTMTEGLFANPRLAARLRDLAQRVPFDVVVCFCSSVFQYAEVVLRASAKKPRLIMDFVDIDSQKFFDYAEKTSRWSWKRPLYRMEGRRLRRLETQIEKVCDQLFAVTPEEVALFQRFCQTDKLIPISNGVDTAYFDGTLPQFVDVAEIPYRCVFVGAMDYHANVGGAEWFIHNVLPQLRQRFPQAEFDVVGSKPASSLVHLCQNTPGANLVGAVPDVRPYLKRASVVVVPLQVARGIQNKVLEACAMGKPTVVSPSAAEGIQTDISQKTSEIGKFPANPPFLVCETAEEWVEQVANLYEHGTLRKELAASGRQLVEQSYGWSARLSVLENFLSAAGRKELTPTMEKQDDLSKTE